MMLIRAQPTKVCSGAGAATDLCVLGLPAGLAVDNPVEVVADASEKLVQAHYADAMILLGDAEKTEQAGPSANVAWKPVPGNLQKFLQT